MSFLADAPPIDPARNAIASAYRAVESARVEDLLALAALPADARARIEDRASRLVEGARGVRPGAGGLDAFLHEYSLSTREGVVLMCLAEALLRIPDADTADRLIRDKIALADWDRHVGRSDSILVNASTWGLMLTGRLIRLERGERDLGGLIGRLIARSGEPLIREALTQAMRIIGRQFVMGRTIEEGLARAESGGNAVYRYSFDMLGEAARTQADAERYLESYGHAVDVLSRARAGRNVDAAAGLSVKLSALHPRYEIAQRGRVLEELVPRLARLAARARTGGIGLTVDAEEAARLDLSLEVIERVIGQGGMDDWAGFGLAVQAYQKRAPFVIDWLAALARRHSCRLTVRLVKGAYWDSEIKRAQELGLESYPVFTRKASTDVSYIACVRRLFAAGERLYPQFATHNAHTVAAVLEIAAGRPFEFQRLHGMGEPLYGQIVTAADAPPCRVYAPVGSHEDLLPYLVRRLLENGANTSFVNRWIDDAVPVAEIVADPIARTARLERKAHPRIPLPPSLYGAERRNARGMDLTDPTVLAGLAGAMTAAEQAGFAAAPLVAGASLSGTARQIASPADRRSVVGTVIEADATALARAIEVGAVAQADWDAAGAEERTACLGRAADMIEAEHARLMAVCVREAGKTVADALAEIREAVDYCRYYAAMAQAGHAQATTLPGPTGERNELRLHGRGLFACISPWNFPVAIFTGQIAAALLAGNAVIAKPAEQTPLAAAEIVRILHRAGVPGEVLHLLPGDGATIGAALVRDPRVAGVAFTGSTETAQAINRILALRRGPIVPLIAETGGQNAMIVDSSALAEQVVGDVVASAFLSAGQRCSALRVLFLQEDVADRIIEMLTGAMAELRIGDPALLATDIGPVIDDAARIALENHAARMAREGRLLWRAPLPAETAHGSFFPHCAFEIDRLERLEREVFGPVLHVVRYASDRLAGVLDQIRATGYGLTLGIHSRIDETVEHIRQALPVGNVYVNRGMVGAVVGVQPFGGEGLSGTGPKAGGPNYLTRFAVERAVSVNTAATGGNAALLSLSEDDA